MCSAVPGWLGWGSAAQFWVSEGVLVAGHMFWMQIASSTLFSRRFIVRDGFFSAGWPCWFGRQRGRGRFLHVRIHALGSFPCIEGISVIPGFLSIHTGISILPSTINHKNHALFNFALLFCRKLSRKLLLSLWAQVIKGVISHLMVLTLLVLKRYAAGFFGRMMI